MPVCNTKSAPLNTPYLNADTALSKQKETAKSGMMVFYMINKLSENVTKTDLRNISVEIKSVTLVEDITVTAHNDTVKMLQELDNLEKKELT